MIINNRYGTVGIANQVIAAVASSAASECFGVRGMTEPGALSGLVSLLRGEVAARGTQVRCGDGSAELDVHIAAAADANLGELGRSIRAAVKYNVERLTGITVTRVNIFIDAIKA